MITQIALKGPIRFNSRTGEPSSVQIAGAILKAAFELEDAKGQTLLNDKLFAVSGFLRNKDSKPLLRIENYLTITGKIVQAEKRKKMGTLPLKLSDLNRVDEVAEKMINRTEEDEDKEEVNEKKEQEEISPEGQIYRISNSRPNTKDKKMFYYKVVELNNPFLLISHSTENKGLISECLKRLAYTGLGADKSIGLGAFSSGFEVTEIPVGAGSKRLNISHYIPSEKSIKVQSRITKYAPYDGKTVHEVFCHNPFGIVELDKEVDGTVIKLGQNKVLNFRSILLPVNL